MLAVKRLLHRQHIVSDTSTTRSGKMGMEDNLAVDAVLMALGWRGRYQLLQLTYLLMCVIPMALNILSVVFIAKSNDYRCRGVGNSTSDLDLRDMLNVTYGHCSVTWLNVTGEEMEAPCPNGLQYADPVDRSMVSEWGLVCDKEFLSDFSQTLLLGGMMVGAVLFTSLADRYGRKPFHIGCHVALCLIGVAQAFVPNIYAFLPLRFFMGAFQQGTGLTAGILCMEILPAQYRYTQSFVGAFLWSFGMVVLVFISFLMRNLPWRYLQLVIAGFSAYSIFQAWFTDESLRWLVANGRVEQAERILRKAARLNKVSQAHVLHVFRTRALKHADTLIEDNGSTVPCVKDANGGAGADDSLVSQDDQVDRSSVLDFVKNKHVFLCIIINGFVWMINAMTYYGLSMTSVSLADNMYLGFFLSVFVELPVPIAFVFLDRVGRKRYCDVFHVLAGVSLLVSVALNSLAEEGEAVRITSIALSLVGKFSISLTFAVLFLYTPEQFPTNIRNVSLGIASMLGRIGGMVAPYSRTLARHVSWGPGTLFGVCCLLLPVCMRTLHETSGRELPQTIQEMIAYITASSDRKKKDKEIKEQEKSDIV